MVNGKRSKPRREDIIDLEEVSPGVYSSTTSSKKPTPVVEKRTHKMSPLLTGYLQGLTFITQVEDFLEYCLNGMDRK